MRYVYRYRIILDNGKIAGKDLTLEQSEVLSAKLGANGIDHVIRSSLIPCPYGELIVHGVEKRVGLSQNEELQ